MLTGPAPSPPAAQGVSGGKVSRLPSTPPFAPERALGGPPALDPVWAYPMPRPATAALGQEAGWDPRAAQRGPRGAMACRAFAKAATRVRREGRLQCRKALALV
jgi:hypothetical protein